MSIPPPPSLESLTSRFLGTLVRDILDYATQFLALKANPPLLATLTTKDGLSLLVSGMDGTQLAVWNAVAGQPPDVTVTVVPGRTLVINGQTVKT